MEYLLLINVVLLLICLLYIRHQRNNYFTDIQKLNSQINVNIQETSAIKTENTGLQQEKQLLLAQIKEHETTDNELRNQIDLLKSQIISYKEGICSLQQNLNEKNEQLEILQDNLRIKDSSLSDMSSELEEMQQKEQLLLAQPQEYETTDNNDNQLLDQIDSLKSQIISYEEKNRLLLNEKNRLEGIVSNNETTISFLNDELKSSKKSEEQKMILPGNNIVVGEVIKSEESISDVTKQRTIDVVIDIEKDCEVRACDFFSQPENIIFKMRTELQKAVYLQTPKFVCKYCGQMVKISGRKGERGKAIFFSHLRDSEDCDYKTTTGQTKRDIERKKYARCNEGERHKCLKEKLANYLRMTDGVNDVMIEHTIKGEHPILKWRRPDVIMQYKGLNIVFELQLTTTFVSVMAERDLFYRLNKIFIIWVFNFDDNTQYLNLENMMTKDVYYNNRMNIFIFDEEAQIESEKRHQLVLKCNWIAPNGEWKYPIKNSSKISGIFVTLDELQFDETYKPYYYDAETDYFKNHPEYKIRIVNVEEENKQIIQALDAKYVEEQENVKSKLDKLQEAFELETISKSTKKYVIGLKDEKYGLITMNGDVIIDFQYDKIESHRNWIEAIQNRETTLYDKNTFEAINTGMRTFSKLADKFYIIGKMIDNNYLQGIMNNRGIMVTPVIYSKIDLWCDKLLVTKNGKQSILSFSGEEIIGGYDSIGLLENGKARIEKDGIYGFIDSDCNYLCSEKKILDDKYTKVKKMPGWGICIDNKEYVPCSFDEIGSYRGEMVGVKGAKIEIIHRNAMFNCPVATKYLRKNERNMLIFEVGKREAFMNPRQQAKAFDKGLKCEDLHDMYVSFVNIEKQLLYLSATPVKPVPRMRSHSDTDYAIGEKHIGKIVKIISSGLIVRLDNEDDIYVHNNMFKEHSIQFKVGQELSLEKTGYDKQYNKHIWKISI